MAAAHGRPRPGRSRARHARPLVGRGLRPHPAGSPAVRGQHQGQLDGGAGGGPQRPRPLRQALALSRCAGPGSCRRLVRRSEQPDRGRAGPGGTMGETFRAHAGGPASPRRRSARGPGRLAPALGDSRSRRRPPRDGPPTAARRRRRSAPAPLDRAGSIAYGVVYSYAGGVYHYYLRSRSWRRPSPRWPASVSPHRLGAATGAEAGRRPSSLRPRSSPPRPGRRYVEVRRAIGLAPPDAATGPDTRDRARPPSASGRRRGGAGRDFALARRHRGGRARGWTRSPSARWRRAESSPPPGWRWGSPLLLGQSRRVGAQQRARAGRSRPCPPPTWPASLPAMTWDRRSTQRGRAERRTGSLVAFLEGQSDRGERYRPRRPPATLRGRAHHRRER